MEDYGAAMSRAVEHFKAQGVTCFIFGDIFLHDVRKYREQQLAPHGIEVIASLPAGVDPNGENGEYHTFCYDGPIFRIPVPFRLGTPLRRSYRIRLDDGSEKSYSYWFADLQQA